MPPKIACPNCGFPFRLRSQQSKCPKCGRRISQQEAQSAAIIYVVVFAILIVVMAIASANK